MAGEPFRGPTNVGQIALDVSDLERATAFYRDVLRLPLLFSTPKTAFLRCGDVRLMLAVPEKAEFERSASILYYRVEDLNTAAEAMKAGGAKSLAAPHLVAAMENHDLWMAFFEDCEGNTFALMCEAPRA